MRTKRDLEAAIRRERRAALIVNAHSRQGRRFYEAASSRLADAGFTLLGSYPVDRPAQLEETVAAAIDLAPDLLIAGGGDGTIGAAARLLAHQDIAFGVLPLGTTNNFARTIGVPLGLEAAVATLTEGKVIDVDLGLADEASFANHVAIGLSAEVMVKTPRLLKRFTGRLAYPLTALALLGRHRPLRVTVRTGERTHEFVTHQLYVANGGFLAGRPIAADANADDRLLLAYPVGGRNRWDLLSATARNAATGHRRTLGDEPMLAVDDLWLETDRPAPVEVDGEVGSYAPVRVRLDPNALRVMAPADSPDH